MFFVRFSPCPPAHIDRQERKQKLVSEDAVLHTRELLSQYSKELWGLEIRELNSALSKSLREHCETWEMENGRKDA